MNEQGKRVDGKYTGFVMPFSGRDGQVVGYACGGSALYLIKCFPQLKPSIGIPIQWCGWIPLPGQLCCASSYPLTLVQAAGHCREFASQRHP